MRRLVIAFLTGLTVLTAGIGGGIAAIWSPIYLWRLVFWDRTDPAFYDHFPVRTIAAGARPFPFLQAPDRERVKSLFTAAVFHRDGRPRMIDDLEKFLTAGGTTALIVVQDDAVLYEGYFNGRSREDPAPAFELGNAVISALVGVAVTDGKIAGLGDSIARYLPVPLSAKAAAITIRDLLATTSGIRFRDAAIDLPWNDGPKIDFATDLRRVALSAEVTGSPGTRFHANGYDLLLLGLILEQTAGSNVSDYLERMLWRPLGMEFTAAWALDDTDSGFERMDGGFAARPIDYARLGRLFLNGGIWNGVRILPTGWVRTATAPPEHDDPQATDRPQPYRKHLWSGYARTDGSFDFFVEGLAGQVLYVSPSRRLILVRTGLGRGGVDSWPELFFDIASRTDSPDGE
jgi:CubicO group peptidase (beta-lactamase class C family)